MKKDIKIRIWGRVIMLPYYSKYIFFAVLALIAVIIGIFISREDISGGAEIISPLPVVTSTAEPVQATPFRQKICKVYVVGAVKNPGIFEVTSGALVSEAVEAAGGFSDDADPECINLVDTIDCNVMIKVPAIGETGGAIISGTAVSDSGTGSGSGGSSSSVSGKVNINTADVSLLCTIPGVGESTASKIIKYRETNGRFNAVEDIMNISGIKQAKFESMRDYICVE